MAERLIEQMNVNEAKKLLAEALEDAILYEDSEDIQKVEELLSSLQQNT